MTIIWEVNIVVFISRMFGVIIDNLRGDPIFNMFPVIKISNRNTTAYATTFPRVIFGMGHIEQLGDTPGHQLGNISAWSLVWYIAWCRTWCRT